MRKFVVLSLLLGLSGLLVAGAQPPGPGGQPKAPDHPAGPPLLALLNEKSIQADLKMTPDQNQKLSTAMTRLQTDMRAAFAQSPDQGRQRMQQLIKASDQAALEVLTEPQKKRLRQITLQMQGSLAFADPDVAKRLHLTEDQQSRIQAINAGVRKQLDAMFQGGQLPPQAFQKKMEEIKANSDDQARKVLTPEQSSQWQELAGPPFKGQLGQTTPGTLPPPGGQPR